MTSIAFTRRIDLNALPFSFKMVADDDAGTYTIEADVSLVELQAAVAAAPDWRELPSRVASTVLAARLAVVDKVRADALTDEDVAGLVSIFPDWQPGIPVAVRDVYSYDGTLVECIQAHTTQQDWTPPATPSLWKVHRTDDGTVPLAWMPGLALTLTDQVTYDGILYDVLQAHTSQTGWEPPATPALFAEPAA